ncbi:amino acid ABC transporter permease [Mobilitalea sibirica]|uniref:Amino acid ABC transporter permease n=2 Tax=Mobilitalea sibirica TaxID=1462919 RepID=A0A8J7KXA2_9FIRM|nr:amino acid ABC transporter permease [Mobilitalea sibirica]
MTFFEGIQQFFTALFKFMPKFLPGVGNTLLLSVLSILLGTVIGLFAVMLRLSKKKPLVMISNFYITIIRGTPLLLQLYFIFFGLPDMGIMIDRFPSAVLGLAIHSGAYISEIFRGSIESIDYGQREAAKALGMTNFQAMKRIILPQAFKRSVPALGNQFIISIKDSSLASVITITETILLARQFAAATFNVFPIYTLAGAYYLLITLGLSKVLNKVELRLKVNER